MKNAEDSILPSISMKTNFNTKKLQKILINTDDDMT